MHSSGLTAHVKGRCSAAAMAGIYVDGDLANAPLQHACQYWVGTPITAIRYCLLRCYSLLAVGSAASRGDCHHETAISMQSLYLQCTAVVPRRSATSSACRSNRLLQIFSLINAIMLSGCIVVQPFVMFDVCRPAGAFCGVRLLSGSPLELALPSLHRHWHGRCWMTHRTSSGGCEALSQG